MLLRFCSYNLGWNATDLRRTKKVETLLGRLWAESVDLVCLQETAPYAGQSYSRHAGLQKVLQESRYNFHTGGNCSSGARHGLRGTEVRSFPGLDEDKYRWRAFSRSEFPHAGGVMLVLNAHTRAGSESRNDTADTHRLSFLDTCKRLAQAAVQSNQYVCVIITADFNLRRPWGHGAAALLEQTMAIEGTQALFSHSMPDHVVVYAGKPGVRLLELGEARLPAVGRAHDGAGDHAGFLLDLHYGTAPPTPPPTRPPPPLHPVYWVTADYTAPAGGYLSLEKGGRVQVLYEGSHGEEEGWLYGRGTHPEDTAGWFPIACVGL